MGITRFNCEECGESYPAESGHCNKCLSEAWDELRARLTTAQQRVAELEGENKRLREAAEAALKPLAGDDLHPHLAELRDELRAALTPNPYPETTRNV